tara:strand:+ start:135 stop:704 length:570 start_codon:yes stop_codon:yes gene_type:complete
MIDLFSEENLSKDKWEQHALTFHFNILSANLYDEWDKLPHSWKVIYCEDFYNTIFKESSIITGYITNDANFNKANFKIKPTQDHFQVARIAFRAMMKYNRELIKNKEEFVNVCKTLRNVVEVTKEQNGEVKYSWKKKQIRITELAIDKYDSYIWLNKNGRNVKGKFPLKHMFYDWYTQFEKDNLNKVIA